VFKFLDCGFHGIRKWDEVVFDDIPNGLSIVESYSCRMALPSDRMSDHGWPGASLSTIPSSFLAASEILSKQRSTASRTSRSSTKFRKRSPFVY